MLGNVWQRTNDCWTETYAGAPKDGSVDTSGNCVRRMVRGGSWFTGQGFLRSAMRSADDAGFRDIVLGFRLARTLP